MKGGSQVVASSTCADWDDPVIVAERLGWGRQQNTVRTHDGGIIMAIESTGHSRGNPRLYELVEGAPKTGKSPTVWAWPQIIDHLKVASQPVQGPWPPHQQRRPDPDADSAPVAVADPQGPSRS